MITALINLHYKEWLRTGSIIKLVQLMMILIFPIMLFTLIFIIPVIMSKSRTLSTSGAGYYVFIITGIYSLIYKMEAENRINLEFPIDYLPVRKHILSLIHIIFTTIIVSSVVYTAFYSAIILIDIITVNTLSFHSFSIIFRIMQPFFAGLVYIVFSAVVSGSVLGIIGRKIVDNVSESLRKFITVLYFLLLLIILKPYFSSIWSHIASNAFSDALFRFSPVNWALSVSNLVDGVIDVNALISGFVFVMFELFIIAILSYITHIGSKDISFRFNFKGSIGFNIVSPLWNVMMNRWFTMPNAIFMIIWILSVIFGSLTNIEILNIPISAGFFVYTLITLDKLFAAKNEDYRKLFEGFPISREYAEGVFLGSYYILYLIPMLGLSYAKWGHFLVSVTNSIFPATLSGKILTLFPTLTVYSVVPALIMFFPYMWSSNIKGRMLKKRMVILYYAGVYFFVASIASFAAAYYITPNMQDIINRIFWHKGYYVGKTILYGITIAAALIHMRALMLIIKSIFPRKKKWFIISDKYKRGSS